MQHGARTAPRRQRTALALLTGLLCLGAALTGLPTRADAAESRAAATTSCVAAAHRGGRSADTENSLGALRSAVGTGADYLEMDVQVTRDGSFVLMHDETITRTTDGRGRVIDLTAQQLSRYRLDDGEPVPSLQQVLDMAQPSPVGLLLELKWVPASRIPALAAMLDRFGASRVVVNSFSPYVVSRFHAGYPAFRTALDVARPISVARARSYGGVMPDRRHVTLRWLARMRAAGVPTYLWTVDSPRDWARYRGRVTMLLTDRLGDYVAWRRTHCG